MLLCAAEDLNSACTSATDDADRIQDLQIGSRSMEPLLQFCNSLLQQQQQQLRGSCRSSSQLVLLQQLHFLVL
jgi:hypothetical protein